MKLTQLSILGLATSMFFASCGTEGTKVDANEAENVELNQTEETITFTTVEEGSHLEWRGAHLGGLQPRFGKVFIQSAEVLVNDNKVTNASIVIDMKSITVENFGDDTVSTQKLTGHLQTPDFFDTENHSTSKFELTKTEANEGDFNSKVTGNLTILDSTKSISFLANIEVSNDNVTVKSEDFVVNRKDWGMSYHAEGTEGVPANYLVSDEIGFTIDVILKK